MLKLFNIFFRPLSKEKTDMANTKSQEQKVIDALSNGAELTVAQMRDRFNMANPTAVVANLRNKGFAIYGNRPAKSSSLRALRYRLGTPTRAVVAAGYKAIAQGLV